MAKQLVWLSSPWWQLAYCTAIFLSEIPPQQIWSVRNQRELLGSVKISIKPFFLSVEHKSEVRVQLGFFFFFKHYKILGSYCLITGYYAQNKKIYCTNDSRWYECQMWLTYLFVLKSLKHYILQLQPQRITIWNVGISLMENICFPIFPWCPILRNKLMLSWEPMSRSAQNQEHMKRTES